MKKRISITPQKRLLEVPVKWQRRFAEEAAEVLLQEGRYTEMMSRISGLTHADFTAEAPDDNFIKESKPKKAARIEPHKTSTLVVPEKSEVALHKISAVNLDMKSRADQIDLFDACLDL